MNPLNHPLNSHDEEHAGREHGNACICFVFPADALTTGFKDDEKTQKLVSALLEYFGRENMTIYLSSTRNEIFVLVKPVIHMLLAKADQINLSLLLDSFNLKDCIEKGLPEKKIAPIEFGNNPDITSYLPFEYIYAKFQDKPELKYMYAHAKGHKHPLNNVLQLRLSLMLLEDKVEVGGAGLNLSHLTKEGTLLAYYPMHHKADVEELAAAWFENHRFPWDQPWILIRNYFGEKICLYFKFLAHYTGYLIPMAVLGLIAQIVVISTEDFSSPIVGVYAFTIVLWGVVMLEFWSREEQHLAMKWGMTDFEAVENVRPEFVGELQNSVVDGKKVLYFSAKKQEQTMGFTFTLIAMLAGIVIGATAAVYITRGVLDQQGSTSRELSPTVASVMNAVQIAIFNYIYGFVATKLTDQENHRTDTSYEDSMVIKLFMFQFVNSYASFFYIAFIAPYLPVSKDDNGVPFDDTVVGQCGSSDCMETLAVNLAIVLGVRLTIGNFTEYVMPILTARKNQELALQNSNGKAITIAEQEFHRPEFDFINDGISDFAEILIQYGYMTLFVSALPASTVLALLNNHFEIRGDGHKLLTAVRKPLPLGAQDIGSWQDIFELMTTIAVVTNAGIVVFTMTLFENEEITVRFWLFIAFQWFVFTIQYVIRALIPDVPQEVSVQLQRTKLLESKFIDFTPDEDDAVLKKKRVRHDLSQLTILAEGPMEF